MDLNSTSKFLSLILRHSPERIGLKLDSNGWASVNDLIEKTKANKTKLTKEILEEIVKTDEKGRYSYNEDRTKIRANQGHSINVDVELEKKFPPVFLYHGTSSDSLDTIKKEGIKKMSRNYVHLSSDKVTAKKVGNRHGKPIVLMIAAKEMAVNGFEFFISKNGVWQTEFVPSRYLEILD